MTKWTVEVSDDETEEPRGFIGQETEEDPDGMRKAREFDDLGEVREAIQRVINDLGPTVSFNVEPTVDGSQDYGVVYYDGKAWQWELPEVG
jgi:hypothetical protein